MMPTGGNTGRTTLVEPDDQRTNLATDIPLVTPSTASNRRGSDEQAKLEGPPHARRNLFPSLLESSDDVASLVTPLPRKRKNASGDGPDREPLAKRRLVFGKYVDLVVTPTHVHQVYRIIKNLTGSIGGNGHVGPIYGELTMGSMQKMVNLMIEHSNLNHESRFLDVGSGIGKPNMHVAQYPGVSFSCGVEVERSRWVLGMTCLKAVLDAAVLELEDDTKRETTLRGSTVFLHNDISDAVTFDPFTHVYMFSIGFPPPLWLKLSETWKKSQSLFLICYHGPKDIVENYGFNVELVAQVQTSMHGSREGHMGYIYRRIPRVTRMKDNACDPLFARSWDLMKGGLLGLHDQVSKEIADVMGGGRKTRSQK